MSPERPKVLDLRVSRYFSSCILVKRIAMLEEEEDGRRIYDGI